MPEIITKRNLPHWYMPGAIHFVTCRLADSVPQDVISGLKIRKKNLLLEKPRPNESRSERLERIHKQIFAAYDDYLDQHQDVMWLADPKVAAQVRSSLYFLHERKGRLLSYVIMPNHIHLLVQPFDTPLDPRSELSEDDLGETANSNSPLASYLHSLKSFTAHEANRLFGRSGQFWQHESYDHWIRDEAELERIVTYMAANPVKARLATRPHEWFWSSAHDRYLMDGEETAWLRWPTT